MDKAGDRTSRGKKVAGYAALVTTMGLVMLFSLGNVDSNAASSRQRTNTGIASVRGSEASAVAAQADSGEGENRLPGHSELVLQLD